jgi:hypothetical protein
MNPTLGHDAHDVACTGVAACDAGPTSAMVNGTFSEASAVRTCAGQRQAQCHNAATSPLRRLPIRITRVVEEATDALDVRALANSNDTSPFAEHVREALDSPYYLDLMDEPVPVNRSFVRVCGDLCSAALLTHITQRLWGDTARLKVNGQPVYLANAQDAQGRTWCITSVAELMEVNEMTLAELKRARRKLVALSFVLEGGVKRCPDALAFALNARALDRALSAAAVRRYLTATGGDDNAIVEAWVTHSMGLTGTEAAHLPARVRNVLAPLDVFEATTQRTPDVRS